MQFKLVLIESQGLIKDKCTCSLTEKSKTGQNMFLTYQVISFGLMG
jgi:hypothetical protein